MIMASSATVSEVADKAVIMDAEDAEDAEDARSKALLPEVGRNPAGRPSPPVPLGRQLSWISRMVTVTEPSSVAVGAGAASQGGTVAVVGLRVRRCTASR